MALELINRPVALVQKSFVLAFLVKEPNILANTQVTYGIKLIKNLKKTLEKFEKSLRSFHPSYAVWICIEQLNVYRSL